MENARYEDISENRLKTDVSSFNNDENTEIQDEDLKKILQVVNGIVTYKVVGTTKR
ncbi:MAG: hypothetical protein ACLUAO_00435 [Streptococcus sp.]